MKDPERVPFHVPITIELRKRLRIIAKKNNATSAGFARVAIVARIEEFEEKDRLIEEQRRKDREEKSRGKHAVDKDKLAPVSKSLAPTGRRPVVDDDPEDALYHEHAKRILAAFDDPIERRLLAREAVRHIAERAPLTNPGDDVIGRRLEKLVLAMREKMAPRIEPAPPGDVASLAAAAVDALFGKTVNAKKIRTVGEVPDVDEDANEEEPR